MRALRLLGLALLLFALCPLWADAESFEIIVNVSNPSSSVSKGALSKLFLKKQTRWESGLRVIPVDLEADSPARKSFSQTVLDRSVGKIKAYWKKMVFSGLETPPDELGSEEEVLAFVSHNVGAIGYVSAGTPLGDGVKKLSLEK